MKEDAAISRRLAIWAKQTEVSDNKESTLQSV